MDQTYNLNQLFSILLKRIKMIIFWGLVGIGVSAAITFFVITPKYSSQAQLVVTLPQTENTNVNDVNSNLQMINTYKDFIVSDLVLNQVENRLKSDYNMKMSPEEIKDSISIAQNQNSQMFSIISLSQNAKSAANIANTVANIFKENAKDVLNVDRITIISNAVVDTDPVSPNHKLFLIFGMLVGIGLGMVFAMIAELMDRTVKDSQFIVEELGFTILGTVPEVSEKDIANYIKKAKNLAATQLSTRKATTSENIVNENLVEEKNTKSTRRNRSRI
ncbi:hypothetical protein IGK74_001349 [Enterococcus sp. AZ150]|uniref:Capsular polysaccharide biosynthesis protein CpsC n=1 Tax=Enterococcus sulfureus ATCC 49903 TaxID=1140003 RepID=S0KWZ1_9ENTE|nr:Wzz/FepE/Etk N-terminal domain-containing protein [Enterococcus sulfureus]EOT49319.1 hypothetical protein OMY_00247 [Enterococcus sulfureus ATCC 49903]EOT87186.1 hypothetical protein I573_00242 [Enterococcus sulfureus ATCC 49903]